MSARRDGTRALEGTGGKSSVRGHRWRKLPGRGRPCCSRGLVRVFLPWCWHTRRKPSSSPVLDRGRNRRANLDPEHGSRARRRRSRCTAGRGRCEPRTSRRPRSEWDRSTRRTRSPRLTARHRQAVNMNMMADARADAEGSGAGAPLIRAPRCSHDCSDSRRRSTPRSYDAWQAREPNGPLFGPRAMADGRTSPRQQRHELRVPDRRGVARNRASTRRAIVAPRASRSRAATTCSSTDVLDQGRDASEHGGPRQPRERCHVPRHAHTANGWMDIGDEPAVGDGDAAEPVGETGARCRCSSSRQSAVFRPRDLPGPGPADHGRCNDIGTIVMQQPRGRRARVFLERLGARFARARRFLRPALQHSVQSKEAGLGPLLSVPDGDTHLDAATIGLCMAALSRDGPDLRADDRVAIGQRAGARRSPRRQRRRASQLRERSIVRDTKMPCWLAEYDGETLPRYSDGYQRRLRPASRPPRARRGRREGRAAAAYRAEPPRCRSHPRATRSPPRPLPRPFAPVRLRHLIRRLAARPAAPERAGLRFALEYDFDTAVMGRPRARSWQIFNYAQRPTIRITGHRVTLLSDV